MTDLLGDEVRLRPLDPADGPLVVQWRSRPDVASELFTPAPTLEEHSRWSREVLSRGEREEYVICWRAHGDRPVGTVGLSAISRRHRRAEYGILLGEPDARGRGLAMAASRLILARAFGELALERVYLHAFADNATAVALYERLGFLSEGLLRRHAYRNGDLVGRDIIVMGLLRGDWAGETSGR